MRRALGDAFLVVAIVAIGASLGLGASLVYADYLYNRYGDLTYLSVRSPADPFVSTEEERIELQQDVRDSLGEVCDWALANDATVLFKSGNYSSVGNYGVVSGSDLLERELGIKGFVAGEAGAYVRADRSLTDAYVESGTLLPGVLDLPVLGTFEPRASIAALNSSDFYYPLSLATGASGYMFTDAKDGTGLVDLLESRGFEVTTYGEPFEESLGKLPEALLFGTPATSALLVAMLSLACALVLLNALCYRGLEHDCWIRHCCGLSLGGIALRSALAALLLATAQFVVFVPVLLAERSYLGANDLLRLSACVLAMLLALSVASHGIGLIWLLGRMRMREGRA